MLPAARILDRFKIPYELTIVSAHRTPDRLVEYARSASSRGLRTIIAGAGGAAHLPGMVAAMTALPVIGVPVKGSSLDGVDSLHSIVQMPVSWGLCLYVIRWCLSVITARYTCGDSCN
jgi:phosphoribosylaminoimidazole carboxylase